MARRVAEIFSNVIFTLSPYLLYFGCKITTLVKCKQLCKYEFGN